MRKVTRLMIRAALLVGALGSTAQAAPMVCGRHENLVSYLATTYQENLDSIGLTDGGLLLEVFVSSEGSWTILITTPQGLACLLASGSSWESLPPPHKPEV